MTDTREKDMEMLRAGLERSSIALDDWVRTYASEHCSQERVRESWGRILRSGGTLAYIADIQEENRAILAGMERPPMMTDNES